VAVAAAESVTIIVKLVVPVAVGFPEMLPFPLLLLMKSPAGRVPLAILHV
jgi:hypothetical protein